MDVGVQVSGMDELRAKMARFTEATKNLQPALLRAGLVPLKAAAQKIDAGGPGWPANLSGTPLLHHTGRLLSSLTVGGSGSQFEIGSNSITVGTNVDYAAWLQFGTGIYGKSGARIVPKNAKALRFELGGALVFVKSIKGTPPRPFLVMDDAQVTAILGIFRSHVLGGSQPSE